ncbi:hypothetical protein PM082_012654 [Marasmius tenuissimus]|nr:hypothetical protein PM082_012654 [Marasmius tenuissimus]
MLCISFEQGPKVKRAPAGGFLIEGADPTLTYTTSINEKFINNLDAVHDEDYHKHRFNCYRYCYRSLNNAL